jgi:hypothetical protein
LIHVLTLGDAALDKHPASPAVHEVCRKGARDAFRREGVSPVHQLEVQVRGRRVAGVADTPDLVISENRLTFAHGDASRGKVGIQRVGTRGPDDDVVPRKAGAL